MGVQITNPLAVYSTSHYLLDWWDR